MKINWKLRFKNKAFWLTLVPALLLMTQILSGWFGYELPVDVMGPEVECLVNAIFSLLVILGIVNDPTVSGPSDSRQALKYDKPRRDNDAQL